MQTSITSKKFLSLDNGAIIAANPSELKEAIAALGFKVSAAVINKLFNGERAEAYGFTFSEELEAAETNAATSELVAEAAPVPTAETPKEEEEEEAKEKAGTFSRAELEAAIAQAIASGMPIATETKVQAVAVKPPKVKAIIPQLPKGKLKPVRKNTKIGKGLLMLAVGATIEELKAADLSHDIVDFLNRRVTKRGYGFKFDAESGKYFLVLPQNESAIIFSNIVTEEEKDLEKDEEKETA